MYILYLLSILILVLSVYLWNTFNMPQGQSSDTPLGSGEMFDNIAPYYDLANKFMSLGFDQAWRKRLIDHVNIKENESVLDLACGTADVAILLGLSSKSKGYTNNHIYCIDPSVNMLNNAQSKVNTRSLADIISIQVGHAESVSDILTDYVDKVTMSFGIRNVIDRFAALREIKNVLKPNGRVYIMEFVPPSDDSALSKVARYFVRYIVPVIGSIISLGHSKEYGHLEKSIFGFPSPSDFIVQMRQAGFKDCEASNVFGGVVYLFKGRT